MKLNFNTTTLQVVAFFVFSLIAFNFLMVANQFYPYYLSWDMDLTTTIDLLIVQSQRLHVHFAHPGTGMYMILKPVHFLAWKFGLIDTLTLPELAQALNPTLAMAQVTNFARSISPFIITFVCFLLSALVFVNGTPSFLFRALVVALMFSGHWVLQEATFIRTETYAWLYIASSCVFAAFAAKTDGIRQKKLLLGFTGLFLGLAYYSKIQTLTSMTFPVMIYFIYNRVHLPDEFHFYKKLSTWTAGACLFLIIASLFYGFPPDTYIEHFRERVMITLHGLLIFGGITYLALMHYKNLRWRTSVTFFIPIAAGFVSSFFLPLFQYLSLGRGWELMLINFQSVTMTTIYNGLSKQIAPTFPKIGEVFIGALPVLIPVFLVYGILCLSKSKTAEYMRLRKGLAILIGMMAVNLVFVIRNVARHDVIWLEPMAYFVILSALSYLWSERPLLKWSAVLVTGCLIGLNFLNVGLALNFSQFSYGDERAFLKQSYPGQRDYTSIFKSFLVGSSEDEVHRAGSQLLVQARDWQKINYFLRFHFVNLNSNLGTVTSAQVGWKAGPDQWVVSAVSDQARGANLVDLKRAVDLTPPPSGFSLFLNHLLIEKEFARKRVDPREKIYTRFQNDTISQVFMDPVSNENLGCKALSKDLWIELSGPQNSSVHLQGHYCESGIPFGKLKGPVLAAMIMQLP